MLIPDAGIALQPGDQVRLGASDFSLFVQLAGDEGKEVRGCHGEAII